MALAIFGGPTVPVDPAALPLPDPDAPAQTFRTAKDFDCSMASATRARWMGPLSHAESRWPENLMEFDYPSQREIIVSAH
jgi:hypothetical protein